jgi:hypothetical protein
MTANMKLRLRPSRDKAPSLEAIARAQRIEVRRAWRKATGMPGAKFLAMRDEVFAGDDRGPRSVS